VTTVPERPQGVDLAVVYREQKDFVRRVVRRIGVPERDVDDVVQEVFLKVGAALDRFDPARSLRPWIAVIALPMARDHRELRRTTEIPTPFGWLGWSAHDCSLVDRHTPEDATADAERAAIVRHLLGDCDEVLERVILREQEWADIALALGIPLSTVQSRVRRASADLDARLRRRRAAEQGRVRA
jgi:RNA polymerase sigma-70 factor, ECF subfamily